jgi:outer membrane protein OmpA-like peptidoglycan-associated protein
MNCCWALFSITATGFITPQILIGKNYFSGSFLMQTSRVGLIVGFFFVLISGCLCPAAAQTRRARPLEGINSTADELLPVLAPDGKTLYFVRGAHAANVGGAGAGQDIWYSRRETLADPWEEPRPMGAPFNNVHNNAIGSVTGQGQVLWLNNQYLGRKRMRPGLSFSTRTNTGWSQPRPVAIPGFKPLSGALGFFLAPGDSVLMLSMQVDSARSEDLFVSRRQGGQWSQPVNIGAIVNSAGFEISPFLAPDNETLYFASDGHGGLGQADIFRSKRLDATWLKWSVPENLGKEVNSTGFEAYFVLDPAGDKAYFTSEARGQTDTDIYSIRVADITPPVRPAPLPATLAEKQPVAPLQVNSQAAAAKKLLVFFAVGSARLDAGAQSALKQLGLALQQQPQGGVTLSGHADDTGQEAANLALSRQRAQAVAGFLSAQGIKKERLRVLGYGSRQPLNTGTAAADRAENRRVEVLVDIK